MGAETVQLLHQLIDKSLVLVLREPDGTRYRLLDTVRQLAREKLAEVGQTDEVASRHCAHFVSVAQGLNPEHGSAQQVSALPRLERDHDNFRAALRWSVDRSPASAVALAASLWRFWFLRCHVVEGGRWMDRVLEAAPEPSRSRAEALVGLTGLNARRGLSERIRYQAADAVRVMEQLDDPGGVSLHRLVQAGMVWATHDVTVAEALVDRVTADARDLGRLDLVAAATWLRAHCALTREDDVAADQYLAECWLQLQEVDPRCPPFLAVVTPCVIPVPVAGRLVPMYEESLLVGRRVGVALAQGFVQAARAYPPRLRGDLGGARSAASQAVRHFDALGDQLGRAQALNLSGCIDRDDGKYDDAGGHLLEAYRLRHALGDRRGEWMTRANLALSRALQGDPAEGHAQALACLAAFEAVEDQPSIANGLGLVGALGIACGDLGGARAWYSRAVTALASQSWPRVEAWHRILLAELCLEEGDHTAARPEIDAAADLVRRQRSRIAGARLEGLAAQLDMSVL
jgi:tetratricopeptide (TPR) repeat protein